MAVVVVVVQLRVMKAMVAKSERMRPMMVLALMLVLVLDAPTLMRS